MERYTIQQRNEIIKIHYENGETLAVTVRKTKALFGRRKEPCRTAIQKLVKKFELLGQVNDVKNKTRARRSRTTENIAAVAQSIEENPGLSIPRRALELGISQTSLHRILHKDLSLKGNVIKSDDNDSDVGREQINTLTIKRRICLDSDNEPTEAEVENENASFLTRNEPSPSKQADPETGEQPPKRRRRRR